MTYSKQFAFLLALSLVSLALFSSCSKRLPPETVPPIIPAVTTTSETEETSETTETSVTETTVPEPSYGPQSTPKVTVMPVSVSGELKISGSSITGQDGEPVILRGISLDLRGEEGTVLDEEVAKTFSEDWGASVLKLVIDPADEEIDIQSICNDIDICVSGGVYVIVSLDTSSSGDPSVYMDQATDLFSRLSALYCDCPNIIYEICEGSGGTEAEDADEEITWKEHVKPYAEEIIEVIRENDPDNLIIVDTPDLNDIIKELIDDEGVIYGFSVDLGSGNDNLFEDITKVKDKDIPVFITKWSLVAGKTVDVLTADALLDLLNEQEIGWCYWCCSIRNTGANVIRIGNDDEDPFVIFDGHWPDDLITDTGLYVRDRLTYSPSEEVEDTETEED